MRKTFYDHYIFKGSPLEVGYQHGEELRNLIRQHLERIYKDAYDMSGLNKAEALDFAETFEPYIKKYSPDFLVELEGLASGANITKKEALLLQVRQEVTHKKRFYAGASECTSFAVTSAYTSDGRTYSGQNADLIGNFEPMMNIVTMAVTGKPQVMMVLPAGQISHSGMNSIGMSANCNFLYCNGWGKGYPRYLLSRLALEQMSFEAASLKLMLAERSSQRNILLCDSNGHIRDFELTHDAAAVVDGDEYFVHTNHFIIPDMKKYTASTEWEENDSRCRYNRLSSLIKSKKGKINNAVLKQFMSDHENGDNSICVHPCMHNKYHTYITMINNLTDCVMEASRSNPCENEFATYEFKF